MIGQSLRRHSIRASAMALAACLTMCVAAPLRAQFQPGDLVFQHGFDSSGADCTGAAPTPPPRRQLSGQTSQGIRDFTDYLHVFGDAASGGNTPWPGINVTRTLMVNAGFYVALRFNTGSKPFGSIGTYNLGQSAFNPAPTYMTITECPGDFRSNLITDNCEVGPSAKSAMYWQIGGDSPFRCVLAQYKTYYLNMVAADPSDLPTSFCTASSCGTLITPYH